MAAGSFEHDAYIRALEVIAEASEAVVQELAEEVVRGAHNLKVIAAHRERMEELDAAPRELSREQLLGVLLINAGSMIEPEPVDETYETIYPAPIISLNDGMINDLGKFGTEPMLNRFLKKDGLKERPDFGLGNSPSA